ncbi:MAG TPA: hypothetical protein VMD78_00725 [Candidatus Baltobacteraceae bacterium]|nr:hypothetical protein [Candidatus Baltobacteraceae bacterium]
MPEEFSRQSVVDEEHLKILAICYMVSAALSAFLSLFGLAYIGMGAAVSQVIKNSPELAGNAVNAPPPELFSWIFGVFGVVFFLVSITLAGLKLGAGLCIRKRKGRVFCMVVGAIECLGVPYGTLLGIFTFVVLGRESVERLFEANSVPLPPA